MKKISFALLTALSFSALAVHTLELSEIESVRLLGHNNIPQKVLVKYADYTETFMYDQVSPAQCQRYGGTPMPNNKCEISMPGNREFAEKFMTTISEINYADNLVGTNQEIKFVTVGLNQPTPVLDEQILAFQESHDVLADRWLQDWGEIMVAKRASDKEEQYMIFDSNRGRELRDIPFYLATVWNMPYYYKSVDPGFEGKDGSTGNYGGNIEVTPNNVLWIGNTASKKTRDFFINKGYMNNHAVLNVSWLQVGHVDEHISQIVLDESDPCGFAILKADPEMGMKLIEQASFDDLASVPEDTDGVFMKQILTVALGTSKDPNFFKGENAWANQYGAIFKNNQKTIKKITDANVELLKSAIVKKSPACNNIKIVSIPIVFDCYDQYGKPVSTIEGKRSCAALLPGTANMLNLRRHLVVPDPMFTPFKTKTVEILEGLGQTTHLIDDLYYHYNLGEIHCGTNTKRNPFVTLNKNIK